MKHLYRSFLLILLLQWCFLSHAQSPGLIVRPAGGNGITALNPNGDKYSSSATTGFLINDIAESEIPFVVVPVAITEPTGDVATGPSGGFTDIVTRLDGSGFYIFKDATNLYFRLRIGGIISGSKGYSVLLDTDNRMGATGAFADPNYIAPTANKPGNPGFEFEVQLQTNFQVAVYSINGSSTPGTPATFPLATHSQISVALTTDGNNPDYFYDWFVPLSAIGNPASIRMAVTTVTSPSSVYQGSRSDIYGIDDNAFANTTGALEMVANAQPPVNLTNFTGVSATCTAAPVLNSTILTGTNISVTGTWTRADATKPSSAIITLYKNGLVEGTTSVTTGNTWAIIVNNISGGNLFYAKAQASGESECLQSNNIIANACISLPATPVLSCASLKGISGTMPSTLSGNSIEIYAVTSANIFGNLLSTPGNLTYPTATSFAYYVNGCSGGTNNVATGTYMIVVKNGSCTSAPVFVCVSSGSSGIPPPISSNSITLTQPVYASQETVNGTGAAIGEALHLFINGEFKNSITATSSAFSFTGLNLKAGDVLKIYAQSGTNCMTQSAAFTVSCFAPAPMISANATGNLLSGATSISGTSANPGASVQLYRGTSPSGTPVGSPVIVNSIGVWTVAVTALVNAQNYYAVQSVSGCSSSASSSLTVLSPSVCPTITGSYTDASSTVTGTMPAAFTGTIRLYIDGAPAGSVSINSATVWNIAVPVNTLYYNGVLSATAQATGQAESTGCSSSSIVGCTTAPVPIISPVTININQGQTVNYSVSNVNTGNWYALLDNSGKSYATSVYSIASTNFTLSSDVFSTPGVFNLRLSADKLTGCPASIAEVTVAVSEVLPLLLLEFSGINYGDQQSFTWRTAEEKNVSHFDLQKSADGIHFSSIGTIPLQTIQAPAITYQYTHPGTLTSTQYFRLRIVDYDEKEQFSKVIIIKPIQATIKLSAFPNPFINNLVLNYRSENKTTLRIIVSDISGHTLKTFIEPIKKGENKIELNNLAGLTPAGIYFLVIYDERLKQSKSLKIEKFK